MERNDDMPMFNVHLEYTERQTDQYKKRVHSTNAPTTDEASRMAKSVYKDDAFGGIVFVSKIKLVREK